MKKLLSLILSLVLSVSVLALPANAAVKEETAETKGITCTLFGHKMTTTTKVTITHKVYSSGSRCVKKTYKVETCSRCDHYTQTLLSSSRIVCC